MGGGCRLTRSWKNRGARLRPWADAVIAGDAETFEQAGRVFAAAKVRDHAAIAAAKRVQRLEDEGRRPLAQYRRAELTQMYRNIFQPDPPSHRARNAFVQKRPACCSPASVRLPVGAAQSASAGSLPPLADRPCAAAAE